MAAPSDLPATRTRVSVLGVGAMGRLHARVFAEFREAFELVGVFDPRREAADEVGARWSVASFDDEAEAIDRADLVVIASPIEAHAGAARRAVVRGRHVLVEKPVCATAAQAFALARSAGRNPQLFVGHSERFNPVVRALKERVPPSSIRTIRLHRAAMKSASRPSAEHAALLSLGVHDLDLVAYLSGSPAALRDVHYVDDDRADLILSAEGGVVASVQVDRGAAARERSVVIETDDGEYRGDLLARTLTLVSGGGSAPCALLDEEALVAQARAVARAIAGRAPDRGDVAASALDGARALALVEAATSRGAAPKSAASRAS